MPSNFAQWNVGDIILDLYKVTDILGEGGFGKVYKVRHQGWNIDLAVKIPKPEIVEAAGGVENFEREAETWVNLGLHPHTVSCYYVRRIDRSPVVFAEYVAGGSLHDWIKNRTLYAGGATASLPCILDIAIQFAWGLHYAHEQGLIHQDVKPHNVMMTAEGVVKVTDFGLANAPNISTVLSLPNFNGISGKQKTLIVNGGGAMTPAYCSPEQATRKTLTRRTDLWSWAVSVLEMFQGEITWSHGTVAAEALEYHLETGTDDPQLPHIPVPLAQLLRRCFRENPDERPHDMLEVANELQEIYQQVTGEAHPRQPHKTGKDIADSLNNRAVSLLDLGKKSEALQLWEQALKIQPHHPESTYNRGLVLWREAKINDDVLVRDMEQVRQSHAFNWVAYYLLALVHLERDDCSTAIKTLESIQEEAAQQQEVKAVLAFAQERLPNSWQLNTIHHLKLMRPDFYEDYQPEELALLCENRVLKVLDVTTHRCLCTLEGHTDRVHTAYLSDDGQFVVSRGHDLNIKLWEVATGRCLHTLKDESGVLGLMQGQGVIHATIPLTGRDSDSMNYNKSSYLAPMILSQVLATETLLSINLIYEQEIQQARIAFNKGDYVATAQHIRLARSQPGYFRSEEAMNLWTSLYVRLPRKAFSGAWESITFKSPEKVERVCLSADNRFALFRTSHGTLELREVATGNCLRTFGGNANYLGAVYLSADNQLALSYGDEMLKLWDVATGNCLRTFEGNIELVDTICLSADNRFALSGSVNHTLQLWNVQTGRCLRIFEGHTKSVTLVCLSADNRFALSGSHDETLKLWDVQTGRCLRTFEHPDEKRIQIEERNAKLADLEFGDYITWDSGLRGLNSGYLSIDNRFALSGSGETIKLWNVQTGHCLRTFEGHTDSVISVSLSADNRFALSGCADHTLKLWDVRTGRCLHTFEGHTDWVNSVFLSTDGRFALSASRDKTLKLWILDWELEDQPPADWDEGAQPYLENFLTLCTPYAATLPENRDPSDKEITLALTRSGTASYTEKDFQNLLYTLGCAGYGWLRPEGVRHKIRQIRDVEKLEDRAIEHYTLAIQHNPYDIEAFYNRASYHFNLGNYWQVVEDCSRIIYLDPQESGGYFNRAIAHYHLGNYQQAIEDLNCAIQLNPNDANYFFIRGVAYRLLENYQHAIKDFNSTIQINPNYIEALMIRCEINSHLKDYYQAIDDCNHIIHIDNQNFEGYLNRGIAHGHLENYQQAIEDFNCAIQLNFNNAEAYFKRGHAYCLVGNYQYGIQDFNYALQLNPNNAEAYFRRGDAYCLLGKYQQGIQDFNYAIQLNSNNAEAYFRRGSARLELGDYKGGKGDIQNAAKIYLAKSEIANYQQVKDYLNKFSWAIGEV
ncbi:MAG: tetratricopeptide repeat protein [Nostoc sp.]